ncbi:MAG: hypothetical protein J6Q13_03340 [Clostridia bacterium]|nr:hypothetical protein [Clostridia bacterium]
MLAVISFFTAISVYAYFTSTATKTGELTFGTIEVKLLDGESELVETFQTKYLTNLSPGSPININDVTVKNTGTHSAYVLLNLDISIPSKDGNANKLLHYNKWYNVHGEEVNTTNMVVNETKPTLIASGSSVSSNIKWTIPGDVVGNNYKTSTATVNLSVYGIQTNLNEAKAYIDPELYVTYFICSNASKIATDNGTTYLGAEITQDPLRKIVTGKNIFNKVVTPARNSAAIIETYNNGIKVTSTRLGYQNIYYNLGNFKEYVGKTMTLSLDYSFPSTAKTIEFYFVKVSASDNDNDGMLLWEDPVQINAQYPTATSGSVTLTATVQGDSTVDYIGLRFCVDTSDGAIGDEYIYDNIQVEYSATATEYAAYSAVEDTFDINTQTLTRNVAKYEFTGNEGWRTNNYGPDGTQQFSVVKPTGMGSNIKETINSHFTTETLYNGTYIGEMYNIYPAIADYELTTADECKTWLAEQYANGTPVTVWYVSSASEEDKQSTVLTSKNLYNGSQSLKYQTGASDNNTESASTIYIYDDAEYSEGTSSSSTQLGDSIFEYLKDKTFTLSFQIKIYDDDLTEIPLLNMNMYYFDGTTTTSQYGASHVYFDKTIDGEWQFASLTIPALTEVAPTANQYRIWLFNYSGTAPTYKHFEIKDIQIEVGTVPTSFENYDPTEYKRVNGVALRKIGDTKDTYNTSTKKITRNINELVLTGTETWQDAYAPTILFNLGSANYGLSQFEATVICSHAPSTSSNSNFGAKMTNNGGTAIGFAQCYTGFGVSDLEGFTNYLKAEKVNGNPVTLWYVLNTSKTEQLT